MISATNEDGGWQDCQKRCFPFSIDKNTKGAQNQTTASGSTTRVKGVAFSSVAETFGGGQPTLTLDQSENLLPAQISVILRRCVWFWKGPDGEAKALLFGGGGQNKGADTSILSQPRLLRPIRGWDLDNRRLCLLALPTIFHQCLTSNGNQCF